MQQLQSGDVVQVSRPEGLSVECEALAVVVDGPVLFPALTEQIRRCLEQHPGVDMDDLVCVVWIRSDGRWRGQQDGYYVAERFERAGQQHVSPARSKPSGSRATVPAQLPTPLHA